MGAKREHLWLGCITMGPIAAYLAVFYPPASMLAIAFIVIGIKGILCDIM